MPAEWEPHAATWVAWLPRPPGPAVADAERGFETLVRALALRARGARRATESHAQLLGERLESLVRAGALPCIIRTDDVWMRDIGPPSCATAPGVCSLDWTFNAWGGKYAPWDRDGGRRAVLSFRCSIRRPGLVIEGSALEVDGLGTLLATEPTCSTKGNRSLARVGRKCWPSCSG
jgi:agmatine deiminase